MNTTEQGERGSGHLPMVRGPARSPLSRALVRSPTPLNRGWQRVPLTRTRADPDRHLARRPRPVRSRDMADGIFGDYAP